MRARIARLSLMATSLVAFAALLAQPACARQDAAGDPYAALGAGDYDVAIAGLERLVASAPDDARARRGLVHALMEVGRYEDAERAAREAVARPSLVAELSNTLGIALRARGKDEDAETAFERAAGSDASDALEARLHLAELWWDHGKRTEARKTFDAFIDVYNNSSDLTAAELTAVGTAVRYLGDTDPQLFKDAMKAYGEAIAKAGAAPELPATAFEPRLLLGELFLEKYNSTDAQALFREVLQANPHHARALLDLAKAKYFDGTAEALALTDSSLAVNPNLVAAHVFMARLRLDLEDSDGAAAEAEKALAVNPSAPEALAVLAGTHYLRGDSAAYRELRDRALALDSLDSDFFTTIAELGVRQRRYRATVALAEQATRINPRDWKAFGVLGLNRMRVGEFDAARRDLDTSFKGDPYNVWIKNTLDLLDTFSRYRTVSSDRFTFMLHDDESDLLATYMLPLAEEAYTKLEQRYGFRAATPVRVEVYPSHDDFSVRTVGLAGLSLLGVSFGSLLAMDSPAAREQGQFNWGSTLWHEIAHAFTLGLSRNRVPRWLTEGLSVLEQRRARPAWGEDVSLDFLAAYKRGDLFPVSQLNLGFVRPKYPEQIIFSYYEASLVAEMIEQDYDFDAILDMLRAYGDGKTDAAVFRDVLKIDPEALDARFDAYLKQRFASRLGAVPAQPPPDSTDTGAPARLRLRGDREGSFATEMRQGSQALDAGRWEEAKTHLEAAETLFPEYTGDNNAYVLLAGMYEQRGDTAAAAAELEKLTAIDENAYDSNLRLAGLREKLGDPAGAAAALERAIYISPYAPELHTRLAALYAETGNDARVVRERQAVLALHPVDRAEALYQLALAYFEAGDHESARREVLRALEAAPNFEKAQALLLRLHSGGEREAGS